MAKNKPRQEPLKPEATGNNDESRKAHGIPLAGPSCNDPAPALATIQVTAATKDHDGTTAKLVSKRTLDDGTVVHDYA
jgi:hypothetical protein